MDTQIHLDTTSRQAISKHYDLSNDFYGLWLDPSMTYSCALWNPEDPNDHLDTAQLRKIDWHIKQAHASRATRVLDIGCGWGSTMQRLRNTWGVQSCVGLTLSHEQKQYIEAQSPAGIEVRLENWLKHEPTAAYDSIVSIGAFEHFAKQGQSDAMTLAVYRKFFERCHSWLKPGGRISLQTIAYGNLKRGGIADFMMTEIFPESDLPKLSEIITAAEGLFEVRRLRNDREHYDKTCEVWYRRLRARRAEVVSEVGEEKTKLFEKYLLHSRYGFATGATTLIRCSMQRIDEPRT